MTALPSRWTVVERLSSETLTRFPGIQPLIVQLLHNRGLDSDTDIQDFLACGTGETWDPFLLEGMSVAVERIGRAIRQRELIAVFGDFDADGVTSTAVLIETLTYLGARAIHMIPQRDDGYGLNVQALETLAGRGVGLVITVDCGISSNDEVLAAKQLGLDVIVADHHRVTGALPEAVAVVNPRRDDCSYPFKMLAGVGVTFKLAQALIAELPAADERSPEEFERSLLDLVALGTVADVVPLLGENRVLVCRGLDILNRTTRPGVRELIKVAGLRMGEVGARDISHVIGPRLNATGRLGDASASYRLLIGTAGEAANLAMALENANRDRQMITEDTLAKARQRAMDEQAESHVLVLADSAYPVGIVGLVAGRLVEEFYKPAVVISIDGDQARGSARSIAEFDVAWALTECRDLLVRFGGHARAAGFTVSLDNLDNLHHRLSELARERLDGITLDQSLEADAELNLRGVTWQVFQEIQKVGPFGYQNPDPIFVTSGLRVVDARTVGQRSPGHLRLTVSDGRSCWRGIAFGHGDCTASVPQTVDLAYHLAPDEWTGNHGLQLRIRGLRASSS